MKASIRVENGLRSSLPRRLHRTSRLRHLRPAPISARDARFGHILALFRDVLEFAPDDPFCRKWVKQAQLTGRRRTESLTAHGITKVSHW